MLPVPRALPQPLGTGNLEPAPCNHSARHANNQSAKAAKPEKKQQLTGAELYAIHCNRCHAERYATERTDAQWKTIMMHMRVRGQLPAQDAKAILKYLQENN